MTGGSGAMLPLRRFLLSLLSNQRLVDVGNDTCREWGEKSCEATCRIPTKLQKSLNSPFCEWQADPPQCESRQAVTPGAYAKFLLNSPPCPNPCLVSPIPSLPQSLSGFPHTFHSLPCPSPRLVSPAPSLPQSLSGFLRSPPCPNPCLVPLLAPVPPGREQGARPTSSGDGGFDQRVQLLIAADGQLQVPGRDPLHFEILGRVPGQLQHLQEGSSGWQCPGQGAAGAAEGGGPTSAVRYSRMAALYTAAVAPTRPWLVVRVFRCLWMRPTGNWGAMGNLVNPTAPTVCT